MQSPSQNIVFVGQKSPMSYALATIIQFNRGTKEVTLKARGMSIAKAVDVVEIVKRRFMDRMVVQDVRIGTEMVGEGGNRRSVSTIEIKLSI